MNERIVAEVSRNWNGDEASPERPLLSTRFEHVVEVNRQRGYELESWQLSRVATNCCINETILAVFIARKHKKQTTKGQS